MDFLDLQKDLQALIGDTRTKWLPDEAGDNSNGSALKVAIVYGIKQTFDRLKQNKLYKEHNFTSLEITFTNGEYTLPADYEMTYEILNENGNDFFDYIINDKVGKILFDDTSLEGTFTFRYLVKEKTLSLITDEPYLDEHFKECVANFGIEKYHQAQFDWDNLAKGVAYAEDKCDDLISKYY